MVKVKKSGPKKKAIHNNVVVYISSSSNNTIMTIFSEKTRSVIGWSSPGVVGFKGARKSTPYASQAAADDLCNKMTAFGVKTMSVVFKGLGGGRDPALKTFQSRGFIVKEIGDRTGFAFNGCKLPRRPRV